VVKKWPVVLLLFLLGCAAGYSKYMGAPLKNMARGDYAGALAKLEKPEGKTNRLLYYFEKGLLLHYQGEYETSNQVFAQAERLIDQLYTKSVSREIASLLTNDAIRAYSGEEFERALIHYYRALNYQYLGQPQEALVECRKANLRLEDFAAKAEYKLTYKNDAFIQYMTGLFFEAEGELNDAYISYKDADKGYRAYAEAFGIQPPKMLGSDLARLSFKLGYRAEGIAYSERYGLKLGDWASSQDGEVIFFVEHGFIARKYQQEINLPILESDPNGNVWVASERAVYRYRHQPYAHHRAKVKYWLRVALPEYREQPSKVRQVRLRGGGRHADGALVENLDAIAQKNFRDKEGTILLRTVARSLAKYVATQKAEDESELLGFLVNLFGAATEAADTRSWLALPSQIRMVRFSLPPGTVDLELEFLNERGAILEVKEFPGVEVQVGKPVFLSYRSYL